MVAAGGSPTRKRPATSPEPSQRASSSPPPGAAKAAARAKPKAPPAPPSTKPKKPSDLLSSDDSSYGCQPTSKYGWTGGGANKGGVLNSIKVSEVEAPPPPPPKVSFGPSPEGSPFAMDPSKWGLIPFEKDEADTKLMDITARRWCELRGRQLRPTPLSAEVEHLIHEWFELVDHDGCGAFDTHKLQAALEAAEIPFTPETLHEMIELMDFTSDGIITWDEFHTFISDKVHAGQDLLEGMLTLPSGLGLPMGSMIHKMRRSIILDQYFQGGEQRKLGVARAQEYLEMVKGVALEEQRTSPKHHMRPRSARSRDSSRATSPVSRSEARSGLAAVSSPFPLGLEQQQQAPRPAPSAPQPSTPPPPAFDSSQPETFSVSVLHPLHRSPLRSSYHPAGDSSSLQQQQQQQQQAWMPPPAPTALQEPGAAGGPEEQSPPAAAPAPDEEAGAGLSEKQLLDADVVLIRSLMGGEGGGGGDGPDGRGGSSGGGSRSSAPPSRETVRSGRVVVLPASANTLRAASSRLQGIGRSAAPPLPRAVASRYLAHFQPTPSTPPAPSTSDSEPHHHPRPSKSLSTKLHIPPLSTDSSPHPSSPHPSANPDCTPPAEPPHHSHLKPPLDQGNTRRHPQGATQVPLRDPTAPTPDSATAYDPSTFGLLQFPPSFLLLSSPLSSPGPSSPSTLARPPSSPSFLFHTPGPRASQTPSSSRPPSRPATQGSPRATGTPQGRGSTFPQPPPPAFLSTTIRSPARPQTAPEPGPGSRMLLASPQPRGSPLPGSPLPTTRPYSSSSSAADPGFSPTGRSLPFAWQQHSSPWLLDGTPASTPNCLGSPPCSPGGAGSRGPSRGGSRGRALGDSSWTLNGHHLGVARALELDDAEYSPAWEPTGLSAGTGLTTVKSRNSLMMPRVFEAESGTFGIPLSPSLCCVGMAAPSH